MVENSSIIIPIDLVIIIAKKNYSFLPPEILLFTQKGRLGERVFLIPPPASTEYLPLTFPPVEKSACGVGLRRPF